MKYTHKAFTLIELLVVIVIIGILATISTATFRSAIEDARIAKAKAFAKQMENGLVAFTHGWWDFDECSGSTVSGKVPGEMQVGTLSGATFSTDTPYGSGCSLEFDGNNDRVNFSATSGSQEMTAISFWFYNESEPNLNLYQGETFLHFGSLGAHYYTFGIGDATVSCNNETIVMLFGTANERLCSYQPVDIGWHHVAIMFEDGAYQLYLDGEIVPSDSGVAAIGDKLDLPGLTRIGERVNGQFDFEGKIDNLRIWYETLEFN